MTILDNVFYTQTIDWMRNNLRCLEVYHADMNKSLNKLSKYSQMSNNYVNAYLDDNSANGVNSVDKNTLVRILTSTIDICSFASSIRNNVDSIIDSTKLILKKSTMYNIDNILGTFPQVIKTLEQYNAAISIYYLYMIKYQVSINDKRNKMIDLYLDIKQCNAVYSMDDTYYDSYDTQFE